MDFPHYPPHLFGHPKIFENPNPPTIKTPLVYWVRSFLFKKDYFYKKNKAYICKSLRIFLK